ncbi:MAG TPA: PfkB family carbohydrate kinase [Candidatus Acidoferrales bacterium]|nr:PfkB family carbohydrate kinase [Candidatus Acidoferrales bacterium]
MNTPELREQCAQRLLASAANAGQLKAFIGLDGFVDEILHVVDKRDGPDSFQRLTTISKLAERVGAAAGKSTNIEIVNRVTKLGGNGPIMANALAGFGLKVTYLGTLGWPDLHPVFAGFAKRADVHSIAEPGHTDALEFEDGKVMIGKILSLNDVNWANLQSRFGRDRFAAQLAGADLVGFVNWTMLTHMNGIWAATLREICPSLNGKRRVMFFDLADPEKRNPDDIRQALKMIVEFEKYFDVILGLNEKEAHKIGEVLGLPAAGKSSDALAVLALEINRHVAVNTLVIHPVSHALAASNGAVSLVQGPFTPKPVITTGAGDHFNSGFCLGKLLGLDNALCVLTGVATSGHYVRTAQSPNIPDLVKLLQNWPKESDAIQTESDG